MATKTGLFGNPYDPTASSHHDGAFGLWETDSIYDIGIKMDPDEYPTHINLQPNPAYPNSGAHIRFENRHDRYAFSDADVILCDTSGNHGHVLHVLDLKPLQEDYWRDGPVENAQDLKGASLAIRIKGWYGMIFRNQAVVTITTNKVVIKEPEVYTTLDYTVKDSAAYIGSTRRSAYTIKVNGVNVTKEINADLISLDITDNEEDEADDLQIKLADRNRKWMKEWLNETIQAGAKTKGLNFEVWIGKILDGKIAQQKAGKFELDTIKVSGPPNTVTIKCISCGYGGGIRTEDRSKSWESYTLEGIANEIARKAGLNLLYCSTREVYYARKEQNKETDLKFLKKLCQDAGFSLKITDSRMVLYEKSSFQEKDAIWTIKCDDGQYTKFDLGTGSGEKQYDYCVVQYTNPGNGQVIRGEYRGETYNTEKPEENSCLTITNEQVGSVAEAEAKAAQRLRLANQYERTASFSLPGNPAVMAGMPMTLSGFGYWSGKYMISKVKHTISGAYTTRVTLRRI